MPGASYHGVRATTKETWTVVEGETETVFGDMPTYFSGITSPSEARRVPLALGEQARAIDFSLVRARFQVTVPDGWMVKAIGHEGRDITNAVIELKSREQLSGVEILVTNRVTELVGRVADEKNAPVNDATVLLFPVDADRWFENSRSVRATRPDQQGHWQLKGMPAGEYLAIALDYLEVDAWQDLEYWSPCAATQSA